MSQPFSISILDVVAFLGLERDPKSRGSATSFNVRCPFCGDRKYHMNINTSKNTYFCVRCCNDQKGTGALDLYGRVALGTPHTPGRNGNGKELYKSLCEALHLGKPSVAIKKSPTVPRPQEIIRADDDTVDKAYYGLLSIVYFRLAQTHKDNLLKRGLDESTIAENGYRSIQDDFAWINNHPKYEKVYFADNLDEIRKTESTLQYCKKEQLIAGMIVASTLKKIGCKLDGVPGFFKLGKHWCFKLETGMIIPTRNIQGQIVALQSRKDTGNLRYLTFSSKGLPCGVTEGISRAHFPKKNAELNTNTTVILTEGPLKADVAISLMNDKNTFFIALQGVNNKSELPSVFKLLKNAGVTKIYNAFDMDRLTNPFVAKAVKSVNTIAQKAGLTMFTRCWDMTFAKKKQKELVHICEKNDILLPCASNVFNDISIRASILNSKGIEHSSIVLDDGTEMKNYWSSKTKGIDDYLLLQKIT